MNKITQDEFHLLSYKLMQVYNDLSRVVVKSNNKELKASMQETKVIIAKLIHNITLEKECYHE